MPNGNGEEEMEEKLAEAKRSATRQMLEEKGKEVLQKAVVEPFKKKAAELAARGAAWAGRGLLAALQAIWAVLGPALVAAAPYILIVGGIIILVIIVVAVLLSGDPAICDDLSGDDSSTVEGMYRESGMIGQFPCGGTPEQPTAGPGGESTRGMMLQHGY